jgi:hypothetical protein
LSKKETAADAFADYLKALKKFSASERTEHTDRTPVEQLLNAFAAEAEGRPKVQQEPGKIGDKGAPDFKVTKSGMILGYVETKAVGVNLAKVLNSDQLKRYRELSSNILLTDYLEWIWIRKDSLGSALPRNRSGEPEIPPAREPGRSRRRADRRLLLHRAGRHRAFAAAGAGAGNPQPPLARRPRRRTGAAGTRAPAGQPFGIYAYGQGASLHGG